VVVVAVVVVLLWLCVALNTSRATKMPTLEVLDFIKIKRKERYKAGVFFTQTEEVWLVALHQTQVALHSTTLFFLLLQGKALLASVQSGSGGAVAAVTQQGQTKRQKMDAEVLFALFSRLLCLNGKATGKRSG
jgi:hypothetical protein